MGGGADYIYNSSPQELQREKKLDYALSQPVTSPPRREKGRTYWKIFSTPQKAQL